MSAPYLEIRLIYPYSILLHKGKVVVYAWRTRPIKILRAKSRPRDGLLARFSITRGGILLAKNLAMNLLRIYGKPVLRVAGSIVLVLAIGMAAYLSYKSGEDDKRETTADRAACHEQADANFEWAMRLWCVEIDGTPTEICAAFTFDDLKGLGTFAQAREPGSVASRIVSDYAQKSTFCDIMVPTGS